MSYLVLARKFRPRRFSELVGQEHVVKALGNALERQRLHHAYLFTGTRGVGKTTVSRILAKSLNCQGEDGQGGITATPCGVCAPCRDIDAGRFVDYTELDAASNRGVDEVQQLLEQAVYKPVQGRFKVFMIDEVHMLSGHAFNAMLKTLEEPPEYLKFVLATTDPQKVPVTVLSRCLQFNLRPMAPETVREHLAHVLQAEAISVEPGALHLLARAARGSMRDALSLTDQAIAFGGGRIDEEGVRQMLGSADRSQVLVLIGALARADGAAVVATVERLRTQGLSAAAALEDMVSVLQRMAVAQMVQVSAPAGDDDPDLVEIQRLAEQLAPDQTQLLYSLCLHGRAEIGLAPDEYAALTMVLLRLLAFQAPVGQGEKKTLNRSGAEPSGEPPPRPADLPPAPRTLPQRPEPAAARPGPPSGGGLPGRVDASNDAIARVDRPSAAGMRPDASPGSRAPSDPPSPDVPGDPRWVSVPVRDAGEPGPRTERRREASPSGAIAFEATELGDHWHSLVQELVRAERVTALVRELALQSQLLAREGGRWRLRVERESLAQAALCERLQAALVAHGLAVELVLEIGPTGDTPARRQAAAAAERQRDAEALIHEDPLVQAMVRDFGARIVPGSIRPL